jgi:hypothetical protein
MTTPLLTTKLYIPPVRPNLLTGPLVDQAALYGLLKKVRDLGMPLLSVNRVEPGRADASDVKQ